MLRKSFTSKKKKETDLYTTYSPYGSADLIMNIIIHSKYFHDSDWLKAHA